MEIKKTTFGPQEYIGIKRLVSFNEMRDAKTYAVAFAKIMAYLSNNELQPVGAPANIYYSWDEAKQETMMGIGIPVMNIGKVDDNELELMEIEESQAVKAIHMGDYMMLKNTHDEIEKFMKKNSLKLGKVVIEEFVSDPKNEPDKSKWMTNIYYTI